MNVLKCALTFSDWCKANITETCYPFEQVKKVINEEMKQSKILAYITALKKLCNHPKVHISGE